jgi:hypothetical protein
LRETAILCENLKVDTQDTSSMADQDLNVLVAQLHAQLARSGEVDAESRALLTAALHDIEATLARSADATPAAATLGSLAARFEADHPTLVVTLRQLADALGKAGI